MELHRHGAGHERYDTRAHLSHTQHRKLRPHTETQRGCSRLCEHQGAAGTPAPGSRPTGEQAPSLHPGQHRRRASHIGNPQARHRQPRQMDARNRASQARNHPRPVDDHDLHQRHHRTAQGRHAVPSQPLFQLPGPRTGTSAQLESSRALVPAAEPHLRALAQLPLAVSRHQHLLCREPRHHPAEHDGNQRRRLLRRAACAGDGLRQTLRRRQGPFGHQKENLRPRLQARQPLRLLRSPQVLAHVHGGTENTGQAGIQQVA